MDLIKPKEVTITNGDGEVKTFIISKFPAVESREIFFKTVMSNLPKLGEYGVSEEIMLKAMHYVAVIKSDGKQERLVTKALVNNHVQDFESLTQLEGELGEYNYRFLRDGKILTFFEQVVQIFTKKISEILMGSSELSSTAEKPPSTN